MTDAIVDACCFINVYATGGLREFLAGSEWTWHISRAALAESLYIRVPTEKHDFVREPIEPKRDLDGLARREGPIGPIHFQDHQEFAALHQELVVLVVNRLSPRQTGPPRRVRPWPCAERRNDARLRLPRPGRHRHCVVYVQRRV